MIGRTLLRLALVAGLLLLVADPLRGAMVGAPRPAPRMPLPPAGLPPQLADVVAGAGELQRGSLAGRLSRRASAGAGAAPAHGRPRPFADRGSRRQIARLRHDVRRALRAASTAGDRTRVQAWHGVYVSGRRAVAVADLRRTVRTRAGMPSRRLPAARVTLTLRRDGGGWRVLSISPAGAVASRGSRR